MTVKVEYTILTAVLALAYLLIKKFAPDAPISPDVLLTFALYVLAKLGVEVIGKPALRKLFPNRFSGSHYVKPE
jgi:hypothetical protein